MPTDTEVNLDFCISVLAVDDSTAPPVNSDDSQATLMTTLN
jgi:hypothetical protein